jgi:DNA-binding transcriptional ArsR family regulator
MAEWPPNRGGGSCSPPPWERPGHADDPGPEPEGFDDPADAVHVERFWQVPPASAWGSFTAADLERMTFPPLRYAVPGLLPEGLALLAGRPKFGKSFLCLDLAIAVATGGLAFGQLQCDAGDVLFLALEDSRRRLKSRLAAMLPGGGFPPRLMIETEAPRLDAGLVERLTKWIARQSSPRLIVIDTLRCVRPPGNGRGGYDEDAEALAPLLELARSTPGLCILVVHHTRKADADDTFDTISGTFGLTGVADTLLVFGKHGEGAKLAVQGRDIDAVEKAFRRDPMTGGWLFAGDARDIAKTGERQAIVDELNEASGGPLTTAQIARALGKKPDTVSHLLRRLADDGQVARVSYGKWKLPDPHSSCSIRSNWAAGADAGTAKTD